MESIILTNKPEIGMKFKYIEYDNDYFLHRKR